MLFEGRYNAAKQLQSQRHYIWLNDTPVGFVIKDGASNNSSNNNANNNNGDRNIYAIHTDHLNTPRLLTNQDGAEVWRWASDAFGEGEAVGSIEFNLRFPGQYYDGESGLHYNYFRDYNAQTGRYVQSDPIGLAGGLNTYLYANGNAVNYADPLGLYPGEQYVNYVTEAIGGNIDFGRNYIDMRNANTIGSDKYFHCKANCEAAKRGDGGEDVAQCISDTREWFDQRWPKNDKPFESASGQFANLHGRYSGSSSSLSCSISCSMFRPNGLNSRY